MTPTWRAWGASRCRQTQRAASRTSSTTCRCTPKKNAPLIGDFIQDVARAGPQGDEALSSRIHLVLSDSTWGQALSLNRHIPRGVPRVALAIDESYEPLFAALRKRTRETGVSTLEATTMAVEQCVRALGLAEEAERTSAVVTGAMKEFVDLKCLLKFAAVQFTTDHEKIDELEEKRDVFRRAESVDRLARLGERIREDPTARQYLLPPVTNYCYCCDCVVGWHRMAEHALGKTHRVNLAKNPTCEPSALSQTQVVDDFSRPMRTDRAQQAPAPTESDGDAI
ncbi:hypothetical protein STCU_10076 [Strigomonas culicis]|uniref:tRNA-uridine aminocarboxypropyltransferase n=1 Tax=Strigomonas culicis TaxID=28005 RepID=S9TNI0_9TRYP|nr:hypothetical protein STCU_10076 [Strigomonas culicis]|eukprot:EPY18284.1 hypothetical protein STCU_10076 [Strigomonas culicis]